MSYVRRQRNQVSSPATFAASLTDRVATGTLELGTNFKQFAAANGASWERRLLVTFVIVLLH